MSNYEETLTASFMTAGMLHTNRNRGVYEAWNDGGVELHSALIEFVDMNHRTYNILNELEPDGCNSCWEYDVSETFGQWFGNRILDGRAPSREEAILKFAQLGVECWDTENKKSLSIKVIARLTGAVPKTSTPTEPTKSEMMEGRLNALRDETENLARRVRELEQRYEGFLVGLDENIAKQVAKKFGDAFRFFEPT